jgi:hypothetical protein
LLVFVDNSNANILLTSPYYGSNRAVMKARSKEANAAYSKAQRAKHKSITPVSPMPERITRTVSPTPIVSPSVSPCLACADKDTVIKILRAKLAMTEKELSLLKRERIEQRDGSKDAIPRNAALRPGAHPSELYGA